MPQAQNPLKKFFRQPKLYIKLPSSGNFYPAGVLEKTYTADLRLVLDRLLSATFDPMIIVNDQMTVYIRPLNYMEFTKNAIKTLEEQRIFNLVNDDTIDDEKKIQLFNKSFKKLTDITVAMVGQCIDKIVTPDGEVSDPAFIQEFMENADKQFFTAIMQHLEKQKNNFQIEPFRVQTSEEEQQVGAPKEFELPLTLDAASFFA